MNLRHTVLLTLAAAFLIIIAVLFFISSTYILASYNDLESSHAAKDVGLVLSHLDSQVSGLALLAKDWGAWEDTYLYATGESPGYVDANLAVPILPNLQVNAIIITDTGGNILYATGFDLENNIPEAIPGELQAELLDPTSPLRDYERESSGLFLTSAGTMILAAHPILHSDNSGPPAGMIIMGRMIDEKMLRNIGGMKIDAISIVPTPAAVPGSPGTDLAALSPDPAGSGVPVMVGPVDDSRVMGSTTLEDIRGHNSLLLAITLPRDIYRQGQSTILTFFLIFATAALVVGIIVIWLVDNLLLSRLTTLISDVEALGRRRDPAGRLRTGGNDEISYLSTAMNTTLDELENARTGLEQSERSYRTLIETTPTSIAQTDLTGTILFVNRQMATTHGFDNVEEICGRFLFDVIAPEDRDRAMQDFTRVLNSGQIKNLEYRGIRQDQSRFWMEMSISILRDKAGDPESFIVVARDISARKLREAQLRESEERYRTVFENTGTATVIVEEDATIRLANSEFSRLSGYSREEIEGTMLWTNFVVADDRERMLAMHRARRKDATAALRTYEFRFVTRPGDIRDIVVSIDMIPGTSASIAALTDITERKRAEQAIHDSETRLFTIIDSSPLPQFVLDKRHRVTHWNRALEALTGITAESMLGTDQHWKAFYRNKRPCIADLIIEGTLGNIPEYYPGISVRSNRSKDSYEVTDFFPNLGENGRWLYFTTTAISDKRGTISGAIETLVDITDQKRAQEEVTTANEQLTRTLSDLRETEAELKEKIRELEEARRGLLKSEARYHDIATNIPGIVFQFIVHENDLQSVPFISERVFDMFTLGPDEIYSDPSALFNLIHEEDAARARDTLLMSARTMEPWNTEFRMRPRNDEIRWFNGRAVAHRLENGDVVWDGVLIDITESRVLQEKIGAALREKELLLKEIHHRVKNNIQVIASLLSMQARAVDDTAIKEVLREAQNRVKSIALVHEKLYQSKSLDRIEYRDYLQKISRHLYESYGVSPKTVAMNIHADAISLHIDKAVPCSLIINELLSNAFKHAFPDGRKGDIWIDIRKNGTSMTIRYRDNGIGLPEDISVERTESLGMRLLDGLTRQLHGTIEIVRTGGTCIAITFPLDTASGDAA